MPPIFLKKYLQFWYLIPSSFFLFWLGFVILLVLIIDGQAVEDASIALVVMSIIGGFLFLLGSFIMIIVQQIEKRQIKHIQEHALLICDQVDNPQVWQKAATAYWQKYQAQQTMPRLQMLLVALLSIGLIAYILAMGGEWIFLPIVLSILLGFYAMLGFQYKFGEWQARRLYHHHQQLTVPRVYIGKNALYSEMTGWQSLQPLVFVQFLAKSGLSSPAITYSKTPNHPPLDTFQFTELDEYVAKHKWGFLQLSIRQHVSRIGSYPLYIHIRIPPTQFTEAKQIADRLRQTI